MAYQSGGKTAKNPSTKTPAPTGKVSATDARSESWGRTALGSNGYAGGSSAPVGKTVTSPMADELKRSGDDGTLDKIAAKGVAKSDSLASLGNVQERIVSDKQYPTAFGNRNRSGDKNPTVPGSIASDPTGGPVRQPE
jgi:hypothetical protein